MKVLFLDIDGVLNCLGTRQTYRGFVGIDPALAQQIVKIQRDSGCKVVLASSWRLFVDGRDEVEKQVCDILDVTPNLPGGFRGDEVRAWLDEHPEVTRYAIVDDDVDFHDGQRVFRTEWSTGITDEIAAQIIDYLNAAD
jgi:hypothetical protein